MRFLLIFTLLLFAPILAQAEGHATGTRINLSASANTRLLNDEVVIAFRVERQGRDAEAVRQYVNRVGGATVSGEIGLPFLLKVPFIGFPF